MVYLGDILIFNHQGGMFHDEGVYHEPEVFNPDRFLTSEYGTKAHVDDFGLRHNLAFGSGRVRQSGYSSIAPEFLSKCMQADLSRDTFCSEFYRECCGTPWFVISHLAIVS